ncbi:PucR family transcriptional regulator [Fictibacillus phosphorivorans]|uniref:PucR family transcriptional regulator n=1 Tax=Fictibacillus phosphorivorans TaxID=1221500 RepID=UPI00203FA43F|nr:PucR family transcriptional regulator [Fictibacillus phosphorivorans]MCM3719825.1 PucR family transcriptional regulator ligand-binding domain-containing protein [Fictibacillus phosphorivorans]MCM3777504.1 PucR family transcriptional regulator ligand-binding domain-containing protein [Fictibacillus phosphorivorans]
MSYSLCIQDLFDKRHFRKAEVIAGSNGVMNIIKWVHILESKEISTFIKGSELILTTGIQLIQEDDFFDFVKQLIKKKAAGLCIEYGDHIRSVPKKVIEYADQHQFPILAFHEIVPFIEITQEIHSILINQQYEMIKRLENYSQEINKLTLKVTHYEHILMRLNKYLNVNVAFFMKGQQPLFIPQEKQHIYKDLNKKYEKNEGSMFFSKCEVNILEERYGEVCIFTEKGTINEFELLVLDRTVTALSQYLLRNLYIEEKQNVHYRAIVESWLDGTIDHTVLTNFLQEQRFTNLLNSSYFVLIDKLKSSKIDFDLNYYKLYTRGIFEQNGFVVFLLEEKQKLVYVLADLYGQDVKHRIIDCIEKIRSFRKSNNYMDLHVTTAVGQVTTDYKLVHQSYETAQDTLLVRSNSPQLSYFYEDLYIHHLVLHMQRKKALMDLAKNYLKPLYEYDAKNNGNLITTLQVYLQCNCLKKETAKKLFIVRQTLYHRLSKIEDLIGNDYMLPPKRLAVELMLLATQYEYDYPFIDSEELSIT